MPDPAWSMNFDPSTVAGAIIWGVIAGVATSAFLSALNQLFQKVVIPWYQDMVYIGIDLRGRWKEDKTFPNGIVYHYSLILKQNAHALSGSMRISKRNSPPGQPGGHSGDYDQEFKVEGSTWEGYVTLNMRSDDRRSLSFATSLLKVCNRGDSLIGHMAYRDSTSDRVGSEDISWIRG